MDTCFLIMNPEIHTGIMIAYSANIAGLTGCLQIEEWEQIYAYHHAQNLSQSASRSQHNSRYTESVRIEARGIILNSSDFWTEQKYHRYWDQQLIIGTSWKLVQSQHFIFHNYSEFDILIFSSEFSIFQACYAKRFWEWDYGTLNKTKWYFFVNLNRLFC